MRNSLISFSVLICKTGDNTHLPTSPEITGNQVVAFKPYMHSPARSGCSLCACFCRVSSDPSGCDGSCAGEEGRTVTAATGAEPIGSRAPSSPAPCSSRPRTHCQGRGGGGHTAQDRPLRETGCLAAAKAAGHVQHTGSFSPSATGGHLQGTIVSLAQGSPTWTLSSVLIPLTGTSRVSLGVTAAGPGRRWGAGAGDGNPFPSPILSY